MSVNQSEQPAIDLARGTRLIDIGCGDGKSLVRHGIGDYELVVGVDINLESILKAKMLLPSCHFVVARGESLPFADGAFDRAISNVSIPLMNIPEALREINRVLVSGGAATLKLHDFRFAVRDLWRRTKTRSPSSVAGGIWTVINGFAFHFIGRCFKMPASASTWDSWQSRSAMKAALRRAGFTGRIEAPYLINAGK
ncbi:MAG: class I SAM-dependent methyltransferase [Terriglobia bacterium]